MEPTAKDNFVIENPETAPGLSSEGVAEIMDSSENIVDPVPDIRAKHLKNNAGNQKSKIQSDKTKEMTVISEPNGKSLKKKAHPPTATMVMDSIQTLKKRNGASFEDIRKYMEEKYAINMKTLKHHVDKFLQQGVEKGMLEKIDKNGAEGRFKITKSEKLNAAEKQMKVKPEKMAAPKKQMKVKPEKAAATKKAK